MVILIRFVRLTVVVRLLSNGVCQHCLAFEFYVVNSFE